ncbi:PREDICTED: uncharacterized protein LOC104592463 [Nelumbo nucifera]|uniref:Uncharacterized protein LOC104592463 n=2 Tax=Nelumbo nucifera TaxID=4432 RepID=A0A1U7Z9L4_NELNU|nr:PREDICTED: uncharacterized protein LOC104592463 [Nelumbo nucifera]DAD44943.1 TPA_asm: hypothetical protein HUJ06_003173 [Nelumbo nucifera]
MPRPGPRPYECVRRAWHSDRHQPMRGSLIQEIFRVVNEIHNAATKKNKEWQEKLPIVVLRAEEIMYSKANSEAEYMDLKTLWERLNDAINTIIRRDESTETGEGNLLQPCIEAALHLGCIPRRASRSQRHSNPRCYLNPSAQEPTSVPPRVPDSTTHRGPPHLLPLRSGDRTTSPRFFPYYSTSTFTRPTTMHSPRLGSECSTPVTRDNNPATSTSREFRFPAGSFRPSGGNQSFRAETYPQSNLGCVYPLYYGTVIQTKEPQLSFQTPQVSNRNTVVGPPCVPSTSAREPAERGVLENFFPCGVPVKTPTTTVQADPQNVPERPPEPECDLSLRLGPLSTDGIAAENRWVHEVEDVGSSSSQEGSKFSDSSPQNEKEFCFFPRDNADDPLESSSSKWSSEGEGGLYLDAPFKKLKTTGSSSAEDGQFCWQPKLPSDQFFARMKKPGL